MPLEWRFQPAVKLNFRHLPEGYVCTVADVESEVLRICHELSPLEIVVVNTCAGFRYGNNDYINAGCGMGYEATIYLFGYGADTQSAERALSLLPTPSDRSGLKRSPAL